MDIEINSIVDSIADLRQVCTFFHRFFCGNNLELRVENTIATNMIVTHVSAWEGDNELASKNILGQAEPERIAEIVCDILGCPCNYVWVPFDKRRWLHDNPDVLRFWTWVASHEGSCHVKKVSTGPVGSKFTKAEIYLLVEYTRFPDFFVDFRENVLDLEVCVVDGGLIQIRLSDLLKGYDLEEVWGHRLKDLQEGSDPHE